MKIVILGAGLQGDIVATDLCDEELSPGKKEIIIADYNYEKAKKVADKFNLKAVECDVTNNITLLDTIKGADVVINCVQYNWNISVMKACLEVKANYIDLGGLFHITREQFKLHDDFLKADLVAVLGMGSTPGTMNVMAGYAASMLDTVREAHAICGCGDFTKTNAVIGIPYSLLTIMEEHTLDPWILKDGELISVPAGSGRETYPFF
jgi:lysine 6-dehydrogenase